jgi:hypothetical protein
MTHSSNTNVYTTTTTPAYIKKGLGAPLKSFSVAANEVAEVVSIGDVEVVGSYSWIDAPTPTIAVPGSPNIWTNTNPKRVAADSGMVIIDQDAHHMVSPFAPMFAAIDDLHESKYKFGELDIVSDRNSLRRLFRWATGALDEKGLRIDVERAGQTCLFIRHEKMNVEKVQGFKGYGHNYEEAATRPAPGCEKATGHHRIISINFGGLKILLRFEVHACTGVTSHDPDDLVAALSGLEIKSDDPTVETSVSTRKHIEGITIIRTTPRTPVAQSTLIQIKTRASHRELNWAEAYPQLYLSQTAYVYLAKHTRGNFGDVEKIQLAGDSMKVHAKQAEEGMRKLKVALNQVLDAARKEKDGTGMSLIREGNELVLYRRNPGMGKAVGSEILSRFV